MYNVLKSSKYFWTLPLTIFSLFVNLIFEPLNESIAFLDSVVVKPFTVLTAFLVHSLWIVSAFLLTENLVNGESIPSNNRLPIFSVSPPYAFNLLDEVVAVNALNFCKVNLTASLFIILLTVFFSPTCNTLLACIPFCIAPSVAPPIIHLFKSSSSAPHKVPNAAPIPAPAKGLTVADNKYLTPASNISSDFLNFSISFTSLCAIKSVTFFCLSACFITKAFLSFLNCFSIAVISFSNLAIVLVLAFVFLLLFILTSLSILFCNFNTFLS